MSTLHIEHRITDYPTWKAAFDRFAAARARAGVTAHRIRQPEDDDRFIVVDLEFGEADAAHRFHRFLRDTVWGDPERSPALAGAPRARVLVDRDVTPG
jgi:hypothetical protein